MSSVTYAAQGYTHLPGLTQSPLWMNGHGDLLSRRLLAGPSSVDLVEAFKMDTNSTALVSNMLQTLTSDAVVTLESPDDSTIARHLAAVKKVLCSYAAYLGNKLCVTHVKHRAPQGSFVADTPPPSRSSRHSTGSESQRITDEGRPDCHAEPNDPDDLTNPVKPPGLPTLQDTVYHQSSAIQASLVRSSIVHRLHALRARRFPRSSPETSEACAYQHHRPANNNLQNAIAVGSEEGVSVESSSDHNGSQEVSEMDTDSTALVSNMLLRLRSDAVVTLESPDDSTIAQHLTAVKKVLGSYAAYLGRKVCDTHVEHRAPQGSSVTDIPPPSRSSRHSTGSESQRITDEGRPDCHAEPNDPDNFANPVKPPGLPTLQDTVYHQSSVIQASLVPSSVVHHLNALRSRRFPSSSPEDSEAGAHQHHHSANNNLQNAIAVGYKEGVSVESYGDHSGSQEVSPRSSQSNRPSWLCTPSPSSLPTPSFLLGDVQHSSSFMDRTSPCPLQTLLNDDDSTWKRLEHAISDARNQTHCNAQRTEQDDEAIHLSDESTLFSSDCSLDDRSFCLGHSFNGAIVPDVKQPAPAHYPSFRPFSVSPVPERQFSVAEGYQPEPMVFVSETGIPDMAYDSDGNYLCSGFSGWCPSSSLTQMEFGDVYSGKTGPRPFAHVSLASENDSICSGDSISSTASFMDKKYGHVQAPRPIGLDGTPAFMDLATPRHLPDNLSPLSGDTSLDVYSQITQMLCIPTREDVLLFVENAFSRVMSGGDAPEVVDLISTVFSFWDEEHPLSHSLGMSNSGSGWIEFTSESLEMRIRQEFTRIANENDSFAQKVALIFEFIFHLQVLPSVAHGARRSIKTLVDAVLKGVGDTKASACVAGQQITILLDYFNPSMKDQIDRSQEVIWKTVRRAALCFTYGRLHAFIRLSIENISREMYTKDSVVVLATFLAGLSPSWVAKKVTPTKTLVALLNTADGAPQPSRPQREKMAATLLLLASSDPTRPGCVACSGNPNRVPHACACTAYLELLRHESQMAKSLVRDGLLDKAFECLVDMDTIEACVNRFQRERRKQVFIDERGEKIVI